MKNIDRPILQSFEAWLKTSEIKATEEEKKLLKIAWYNGASTILLLGQQDNSKEMRDNVMNDISMLPAEINK